MNWLLFQTPKTFVFFSALFLTVFLILILLLVKRLKRDARTAASPAPFEYSWTHLRLVNEIHLPVHYRLEGDQGKPLLILIHGLGANLNCWRRLFPLLKKNFRVLAFDLPGFGLTPNPEQFFGDQTEQIGELVISLMESLRLKGPAVLVGNSLGGLFSLSLMENHPQTFQKALLINPALSRKLVWLKAHRYLWLASPVAKILNRQVLAWAYRRTLSKPKDLEPEVLNHLAQNYIKNPEGILSFARYVRLIQDQGVPQVDYSNCLFVFSGGDRVVTFPHQQRISRFFPEAKSVTHPSGGHQLQEDEPDWLNEEIIRFFRPEPSKSVPI